MDKYCKICGSPLFLTTFNTLWCPRCGKNILNQDEKEEKSDKEAKYIG